MPGGRDQLSAISDLLSGGGDILSDACRLSPSLAVNAKSGERRRPFATFLLGKKRV